MIPQNKVLASLRSPTNRCFGHRARCRRSWAGLVLPICTTAVLIMGSSRAGAQAPNSMMVPPPAPPVSTVSGAGGSETPFLAGLPNPNDLPASLFAPSAGPAYTCEPLPGPYFDCDARLDPPVLPQPGWVADVEVDVTLPHVSSGIHDTVTLGGVTSRVAIGSARLDWTGSPRVELGYRLPDGFGEFDVAYRFLGARGTGTIEGPGSAPDGPASLTSRLDIQVADLDYASNELSICCWWLKWRLGLRGADIFFDSRADEDPAVAAGGSGIFERRLTNNYWGIGPHAGLDFERRLSDTGLALVGRLDGAILLGRLEQGFFEVSTTPGLSAQTIRSNPQAVPTANVSLGLAWRPPSCQALRLFVGYQGEGWWSAGKFADSGSDAQIFDQGVLLRVDFNY
jgi:hypothetical protein